ncbi:hypothetical protein ElyMa_003012700 [Elysia marginata]|uniref:Uncharacterized protein n=1 Tax=Elysia marginata TaxID=1093978 RepID=A0AAV4IFU4_9GAST|nr:hypothetical protein ElyMa_003012700 [Elysia marginata]
MKYRLVSTSEPYIYCKVYQEKDEINLTAIMAEIFFDTLHYLDKMFCLALYFETFYASMLVFAQNHCSLKEEARKLNTEHKGSFGLLPDTKSNTSRSKAAERGDIFLYVQVLKLIEMHDRFTYTTRMQTDRKPNT